MSRIAILSSGWRQFIWVAQYKIHEERPFLQNLDLIGGPSAKRLAPDYIRTERVERFIVCEVKPSQE